MFAQEIKIKIKTTCFTDKSYSLIFGHLQSNFDVITLNVISFELASFEIRVPHLLI